MTYYLLSSKLLTYLKWSNTSTSECKGYELKHADPAFRPYSGEAGDASAEAHITDGTCSFLLREGDPRRIDPNSAAHAFSPDAYLSSMLGEEAISSTTPISSHTDDLRDFLGSFSSSNDPGRSERIFGVITSALVTSKPLHHLSQARRKPRCGHMCLMSAHAVECCTCMDERHGTERQFYHQYIDSGASGRYAPRWLGYCHVCRWTCYERNPDFEERLKRRLGYNV